MWGLRQVAWLAVARHPRGWFAVFDVLLLHVVVYPIFGLAQRPFDVVGPQGSLLVERNAWCLEPAGAWLVLPVMWAVWENVSSHIEGCDPLLARVSPEAAYTPRGGPRVLGFFVV